MTTKTYRTPICKCIALQSDKPILSSNCSINDWENGTTNNSFMDPED